MSITVYLPGHKYNLFVVSFGLVLIVYYPVASFGATEHLQLKVNFCLYYMYEFAVLIIEPSGTVISH